MQSDFFQKRLAKEGIALVTPGPADQEVIQQIIDAELMHSVIDPCSRRRLLDIVARHAVDGVALGCMRRLMARG